MEYPYGERMVFTTNEFGYNSSKKRSLEEMKETDINKEGDIDRASKVARTHLTKVSVYDLLQMELINAGDKVTFKREEADPGELTAEGYIQFKDQIFTTLSAFARFWNLSHGTNASYNGWDVVYCRGHPMKYYKSLAQSPDFVPPCCPFSKTKKYFRKDPIPLKPTLLLGDDIGEEWHIDQKSLKWYLAMLNE